ncbi:hypothetical protein VBH21_13805 [Enterococcus hirae]|uniref:hypothetical protein n=1 Tax=Enterococcus TaxID=1350 RepID=UPI001177DC31|nr:hypothetical protein [Enterococcus hirae]EMF0128758.1 hypothetical protein [Enterococcus hirae]EMF0136765.1 hypothetical protein [Enterococcus hirae]EMF0157591.1 hypothetical protein [Enterococcus hirae]EMF0208400.1 hypothetical protein [Enterococcus hirae]EMF0510876.1 hypothetical protein [Enterococcus hirae]
MENDMLIICKNKQLSKTYLLLLVDTKETDLKKLMFLDYVDTKKLDLVPATKKEVEFYKAVEHILQYQEMQML